jgi:hypothetical protein
MKTDSAVATSRSVNLKALGYSIGAVSAIAFSPEFVSKFERCKSDAAAIVFSSVARYSSAGTDVEDSLEDIIITVTSRSGISTDKNCWVKMI